MMRYIATVAVGAIVAAGLAASANAQTEIKSPTLDAVKKRGQLVCGVDTGIPGYAFQGNQINFAELFDFGRDLDTHDESGIIDIQPPIVDRVLPTFAVKVDSDGNEFGGVPSVLFQAPLATYTGWNPRHPATGGEGQIIPMEGSTFSFATTAEERQRTDDPRPSLAERYADRADYLARVRTAAEELVAGRYLLAEDVPLALAIAAERYDDVTGHSQD